ncbi:hypothetical protein TNCV_4298951 [Trichonephila clavipes]|nr:hypothetical protein TNCV_4298951 [Trichonephila clavipes]
MFGDNFAKVLQSIPLSNDTVSRRIDDIAEDVEKQLFVPCLENRHSADQKTSFKKSGFSSSVFNTKLQKSNRCSWSPGISPAPRLDDKDMQRTYDQPGPILEHPLRISAEGVARDKEYVYVTTPSFIQALNSTGDCTIRWMSSTGKLKVVPHLFYFDYTAHTTVPFRSILHLYTSRSPVLEL